MSYSIVTALKILCSACSSLPQFLVTTYLFTVLIVLPFAEDQIVIGIKQYVAFSDWFLSFSNMHLSYLHWFSWLTAFLFLALHNIPLSRYTTIYLSVHLLKDILVASKLSVLNIAAINICVQVFVWACFQILLVNIMEHDCQTVWYELYLILLGNCQTVFQSDYTIFSSHHQ